MRKGVKFLITRESKILADSEMFKNKTNIERRDIVIELVKKWSESEI